MTRTPVPQFQLAAWPDHARATWEERADRATGVSARAGIGRNYGELVQEARALLLAGDLATLRTRMAERRFVRAVITAWLDDASLAEGTASPDLIRSLSAVARPSRLTTIAAAMLFFRHFDRLDAWQAGLFLAVRDLIRSAVKAQPSRAAGDVIETLRQHGDLLLELEGPTRLAQHLLVAGGDVTSWFRANHMSVHSDTRFGRIARDAYYLTAIAAADAEHGDHNFLVVVTSEVLARQRTESTDEDGLYFGHQVLTALTAKATRHPSEAWLEAVVTIGDDPRLSQTAKWMLWWSRVPEENRDRAIRWMRSIDLRAFLDGVEAYAVNTENESMLRMLERRKRLLLGLYEQDRIEDVRLILGGDIRQWIRRSTQFPLIDEARLQDSGKQDTAIIYVDCGDFCLVEGSHNFRLHVFIGGPLQRLADRKVRLFDGAELRETIPSRHKEIHGEASHFSVAHLGFEWLRRALDLLRDSGITVDERGLMTPPDFADLARRRANEGYWTWR